MRLSPKALFQKHHDAIPALLRDGERVVAARAALEQNPPQGFDPAADAEHREKLAKLDNDLSDNRAALTRARAAEAEHQAAEQRQKDRDTYKAGVKAAEEQAKLTAEIAADAEKLTEKMKRSAALTPIIEAGNAVRGDQPFIVDGEFRLRASPGRVIPAHVVVDRVWVDKDGTPVGQYTSDGMGKSIRNPAAVQQVDKETVLRPEMTEPPSLAGPRLADAIVLHGLNGQIWPPRVISREMGMGG